MKKYIEVSPAETMLFELAMGEFNTTVTRAEAQKQQRLSTIAASHPESKEYKFEAKDGKLYLVYEGPEEKGPEETTVPPVSKPRKTRVL